MNKIKSLFYSFYLKYIGKYIRPSSKPFISGDTFREYCDFVYDEIASFNPKFVSFGNSVFVKTDLIEFYFKNIHPNISAKYNLVTHNSDLNIDKRFFKYLDEKILNWFCQNLTIKFSKKIHILPIGLENRWRFKNGKLSFFKNQLRVKNQKENIIFSSFNTNTNTNRADLKNYISEIDFITNGFGISAKNYKSMLSKSMFNICPEGNGLDTHRIWETYALNSIPIVILNNFTNQFKELNLPMIYLNDWSELSNYNEKYFISFYKKTISNSDLVKYSMFEFWKDYIEEKL